VGEVALGVGIAICVALTWYSRWALNVDGVAYLDLARAVRSAEWHDFIQGYWSPLYPALIGSLSTVTDGAPATLLTLSHLLNGTVAIAALALLWWWGRRDARPWFTPAIVATFLLASAGLPRLEAVTPDVLLLALLCWVGYELLFHRGVRPLLLGAALGLSFLAKTSVWPWLLLSIPLRLWSAEGSKGRKGVAISSGVAILLAGLWIVPLSVKTGHPTLGSAGSLNYGWYIEGSDARTPDTHLGRHREARAIPIDSTRSVEVVTFERGDRWTYAPWSDPTAWGEGVLTANRGIPSLSDLLAYWGRQAAYTFGYWILPVLLGVVVPAAAAFWDRDLPRRLFPDHRSRIGTLLLALAGILQFVAIHSEPRLIAPFVFLFGAALLDGILVSTDRGSPYLTRGRIASAVAWVTVLWMSSIRITTGVANGPRNAAAVERILADQELAAFRTSRAREVLVAGPAMPVAPAAFIAGVRIVAQLSPASLLVAQGLPPDRQESLLRQVAAGRAGTAWITDPTGGVRIVPIPEER
jgi:hypothetical protein